VDPVKKFLSLIKSNPKKSSKDQDLLLLSSNALDKAKSSIKTLPQSMRKMMMLILKQKTPLF